jgi:hypothetical protein
MRKILTSAMAATIAAGAVLAFAGPANADGRRYRHHHRGGGDDEVAAAILGGVAGLALGAALSNGNRGRGYYESGYYDRGPRYRYNPRYDSYYGGGYRTCITRDRVYDPYIGRRVTIERRYAC